jgi:uncharacterized protein YecE (DUF72 family)
MEKGKTDKISPLILLSTSTWTYEGWQDDVYKKHYPKSRFKRECLAEYATYEYEGERLFRTVGADHTFYGPPTAKLLDHYASQLPVGFKMCTKVWEEITVPVFPSGLRYAKKAGKNPYFLDAQYFQEQVLAPFNEAFREHTGPFIFEFLRTGIEAREFLPRLDKFLGQLPNRYEYAVEVRNTAVLASDYRTILADKGVSHVYNYLYAMPSLQEQHEKLGEQFSAPFVLFRLLTPRDTKYHDAVKAYEPYDKIQQPLPDMRDQTVKLVKQVIAEHRRAYVLVNNRTEGNAPQTTKALYSKLR